MASTQGKYQLMGSGFQSSEILNVGLDFGTTNTSMAISNKKRVNILRNNRGEILTPSVVAFDRERILIGDETSASTIKPESIIFGMKRFLGRTWEELKQKNYREPPFHISCAQKKPMIIVNGKQLHVEQIVAVLFSKLKTSIEKTYGTLGRVVLTVPPSFGPSQRMALMDAAAIAEIPFKPIEETTAAAIAFACRKRVEKCRNILVFQLGGGSIDIAIFRIAGCSIELLSSVNSCDIGGEDFTQQIVKFASNERNFKAGHSKSKTLMQMRAACEKAKQDLTLDKETKIKMDAHEIKYSRQNFETGNKYFKIIDWIMEFVLAIARLSRNEIDNYFVTGRSAIMPGVKKILKKYVGEDKKKDIVNAGDAAVSGAAIWAECINGQSSQELNLSHNVTTGKINITEGNVFSDCDQAWVSATPELQENHDKLIHHLKRFAEKDYDLNMEFRIQLLAPHGFNVNEEVHTMSGNPDTKLASGFSEEEMNEMINEVKKLSMNDENWLAMDRDKIKLSGDIHETEDEIEELLQQATVGKRRLLELQRKCTKLDNWFSNLEKVTKQDLETCQKEVEEIRKHLKELVSGKTRNWPAAKRKDTMRAHAIGIDLGTTNSCVATSIDGKKEVFENGCGNLITPSCVAFSSGKTLIGEPAKRLMSQEPENVILSIKRIIGRKSDDPKTKEDKKTWQFEVERSESGRPVIRINQHSETFNPEEISGLVLDYMRRIACKKLDADVRDAVVTVPAYFNHMQRTATKTAAELVGLNVLSIINEPTAAAIAFGLVKNCSEQRNILVYDFGGGTFDVTVLSIDGNEFDVKATSGDTHLGGDDLTNRLVEHCIESMKKKKVMKDITRDKRAMNRLWLKCENAKKNLSDEFECNVTFENIVESKPLKETIKRAKFVSLTNDLLEKTMQNVKDAIKEAKMEKEDIHFVVPVGGSCRIPYVKEMLEKYFGKDVIKSNLSPELSIAIGAAVYAEQLKNNSGQQVGLSEVTPLSLGIKVIDQKTSVIIKRNTKISAKKRKVHCSSFDYQKMALLPICQGEKELFKENEYLGEYELQITPKPKGEVKVDVEFSLDLDGVLYATATERGVDRPQSTKINLSGTLMELNISQLKQKVNKLIAGFQNYESQQEANYDLECYLNDARSRYKQYPQVIQKCNEIQQWLEWDNITVQGIQTKKLEIEETIARVLPPAAKGKGSVKRSSTRHEHANSNPTGTSLQ